MKNFVYASGVLLCFILFTVSCQKTGVDDNAQLVPQEVIDQLTNLGFNPDGIVTIPEGYLIERDIVITKEFLDSNPSFKSVPNSEHFHTNALVDDAGGRVINVYISAPGCDAGNNTGNARGNGKGGGKPKGGGTQFDQDYADALTEAIDRFNAEGLSITFNRTCDENQADIAFSRLGKRDERRGVLGSAGFPSGGDPYNEIQMSGIIISNYGWSVNAVATVFAHEMGHCIGLRHTDYYDRSISCGGATANEGSAGIGANHIPGTPDVGQVSASGGSFMLSCSGGTDRPFNSKDQTALDFLY